MDRAATQRLDVASVSPLLIAAATAAMLIALALIPARRRFHISVGFAIAWSIVGMLPELPGHSLAKGTLAGAFAVVSLAALLHPGPRLRLAPVVLWWPILAFASVMFVLYVDTLLYALLLRTQWIILTVTALLTCRTITSREAADALAYAIAIGLVLGVAVCGSDIVVSGAGAFHIGRFSPYAANANQVGVVFAAAVPFSLYAAMRSRTRIMRWSLGTSTALVVGMLIMTASRTSIAVSGICLIPFLLTGLRRSILIGSLVAMAVIVIIPFAYQPEINKSDLTNEQYGMSRLDSLETERYEIFARYMDQSVSKRPITGLLGTSEQSVLKDDEIGKHPHNAYLEMMYLGGIIYTLPMLLLVILTIVAAIRVFLDRKQLPIDPLLTTIFVFVLAAVYVHAVFGQNGWYPTSPWAFIHVVLSSYVLTASDWLQRTARSRRIRPRRGQLVVVSGVIALLVAACSCSGKGNKEVEQPRSDAGLRQPATANQPAGRQPGQRAGGRGKPHWNWKNQVLPETATPREIDVLDHLEVDRSGSTPDLLCAVKLDTPADGQDLRKKARDLKVPMLLVAYQWIVDWRKDGTFDERDKERFGKWIDLNIRPDSRQLVAIDYEHPYWPELRNRDTTPERLAEISAVYRDVLAFAKAKRPKARWGYFGLPHRNYRLGDPWRNRLAQMKDQILRHQDVVFVSIYDLGPGDRNGRDIEATRKFAELTLEAAGDRPVYAFVRGRYLGRTEMRDEPIPEDEFKAQVGAALDAGWNDGKREHKLAGIILWDSKHDKRAKPSPIDDLYRLYAKQLVTAGDLVRVKRARPAGGAAPAPR